MWYILFSIILFGTYVYSSIKYRKRYMEWVSPLVPLLVLVFWVYYLFQYFDLVAKVNVPITLRYAVFFVSNTIIPIGYIFVCKHCHIKTASATTIGMFLLILLNFFPYGTIYLDNQPVAELSDKFGIHIYYDKKLLCTLFAFELVELLQCMWGLVRIQIFYSRLKESDYKFTHKSLVVLGTIAVIYICLCAKLVMPSGWLHNSVIAFAYFTVHLGLACACLLLVCNGYTHALIVDENMEAVYIEVQPKFAIQKEKLDRIMEKEKLYKNKDVSVEMITSRLHTNRTYLAQMMKEVYGMPFTTYINTLRVEEAKRIISNHEATKMEEVAMMSGFASASTFTKTFKAITGVTPHMWRG